MFQFKRIKNLSALLFIPLLFLMACSNQSPKSSATLKKYSELKKTLGPVHNTPNPKEQLYVSSDLYKLYVLNSSGSLESNYINFIAGQRNTLVIHSELSLSGVSYKIVSNDLPNQSEPLKDLGNGDWEFSWTPSRDIARALKDQSYQSFHISIEIIEVTDLRAKSLAEQLKAELTVNYKVLNSTEAPEIVEIRKLDPNSLITKINEGESRDFEVIIKDPSSGFSQPPTLDYTPFTDRITKESTDIDAGRRFMIWGPVEPMIDKSNGIAVEGFWIAKLSFNTTLLEHVPVFPIPNVDGLPAFINSHLLLYAKSNSNGLSSPIKKVSFQITYKLELLRPVFENFKEEIILVKQKESVKFSFKSLIPSSVGFITTYLSDESVKFEGSPNLTCTKPTTKGNHGNQKQDCTLNWKVPCTVKPGDYGVKIIAVGEHEGKNTSTEKTKMISILENKACAPKESKPSNQGGKK